jgi:hypothetical protein
MIIRTINYYKELRYNNISSPSPGEGLHILATGHLKKVFVLDFWYYTKVGVALSQFKALAASRKELY